MDDLQYNNANKCAQSYKDSFKPCYKWMTFNTLHEFPHHLVSEVLNLVINGWPSIPFFKNVKI